MQRIISIGLFVWFCTVFAVSAATLDSSAGTLTVTPVATGLNEPWALAELPDGRILITERGGTLIMVARDGSKRALGGVPRVRAKGQGGLLDIMIPGDFATSGQIYLSYAKRQGRGEGTALAVATLSSDGRRLESLRTIFEMQPGTNGGRHFGSRIVEGRDGKIYLTTGDRADPPSAQDLGRHNGSVIRINRDGSIPADNPFVDTPGAQPEIWSYGHRNPQGAALGANGTLWINEHGAMGGDEINQIKRGANFGWPVISYGRHYSGAKIGEGTTKPGMEQPAHYWDPSIAPSGMMIYSGKLWPQWRGHFFVGSLKFDYLARLDPNRGWAEEPLKAAETERVRDVREARDGSILFLSVGQGALYRLTPAR